MNWKRALVASYVLSSAGAIAYAQVDTGQINGTVVDTTGAIVANATIVVRNVDTGLTRSAKVTSAGEFSVTDLPPGNYVVNVTAPTFGSFEEKTALTVGQFLAVNAKLNVSASQSVEVQSTAGEVELNTTTNEVSQVITPEQIVNLPSLTRNPYDFVAISGNVSSDPNGSTGQGVGAALGGGRASGTEVLLDGVENIDLYTQTVGQTIPLDSVQEYRIITSGFDARYGRATGGVVNLTTKTGTNKFHGSAFEYNRVSALASNTYYEDAKNYAARAAGGVNAAPDHFTRNQFGYSVGGPVIHDKLFFFSSTEWERVRSSAQRNYVVPTAAFLSTTSAATQAFFKQYGTLRPQAILGPTFTVSGTSSQKTALSFPNAVQQVTYTVPAATSAGTPQNTYFTLDRVDYNFSSKTTMFARYGLYSQNIFPGASTSSPYAGYDTGSSAYDQTVLLQVSHVFTPSLIDTVKLSFTRDNNAQPLGTNPAGPTLYALASAAKDTASSLNVALPGYLPFNPGSAIPAGGPENFYQYADDLEYTKGRHDLHFGGAFDQLRDNRTFGAYENSVNQLSTTGEADAFNNLTTGHLYLFQAAIYPQGELPCANSLTTGLPVVTAACTLSLPLTLPNFERNNTFNDGSVYGQDSYKVNKQLTITAGLRWEYFGVQHNHNPNLESNFFLGSGTTFQSQFRSGNLATTPNSPYGLLYQKKYKNFSPRVGFAFDVFGDGKYTVRGGYGISYERNYGNVTYNVIQNAPAYGVISLQATDTSPVGTTGDLPTLPITNNNFGPLAGTSGTKAFPIISLRPVAQTLPTAYQQNYNMSVAHQFGHGALVEVSYAGARGNHLYSIANVNRTYFGGNYLGDTRVANRLQPQYGAANLRGANGDSYYNSMNVRAEYDRFQSAGLHFTFNYTLAHSLDDNSSTFDTGAASGSSTGFLGYFDPFNPRSSFGNSDFDIRNRAAISAIYEPTFLKHHGTLLKETVGGISFAPIITIQSSTPFNVFDNSNTDGQAEPNIINAPGLKFHGNPTQTAATDVFNYIAIPAAAKNLGVNPINGKSDLPCAGPNVPGCTVNVGLERNQFYGPANYQVNLASAKTFTVFERYRLQFRAEFYNLFNHSNFYSSTGSQAEYTSGAFNLVAVKGSPGGTPGGTGDERRNIQLAARFEF